MVDYLKCMVRPSLLLVDDEEEILIALTDLLEEHYQIFSANNPLHALDILRAHPEIITIISDQRMPGLTGERFLAQARSISDARSILLTGYADLDAVVSALNDGHVKAYVHKPWDREALLTLVSEVTQHGLAQRDLCKEQVLLKSLMSALPMRFVFSDGQGRHVRSNIEPVLSPNITIDDIQCDDEIFYHRPALQPYLAEMRQETAQKGRSERLITSEEEDEHGHKKTVIYEITRFALAWPPHALLEKRWQVSLERDVTEKMLTETRLRQGERLESLGTLAGGIAHDFNNLLATISGPLEILRKNLPDDNVQGHEILGHAQNAVKRGVALTRRLLQFGRVRREKGDEKLIPIPLSDFFSELKGILEQAIYCEKRERQNFSPYSLSFKNIFNSQMIILSDPQQLEMALLNLCVNARDAMPHGGVISIEARILENYHQDNSIKPPLNSLQERALVLDICDEGEGIPPENITRIFDPFFTTKSIERGTGLGLYGVYEFMQRNYGEISVESAIGVGTKMSLIFPLYKGEASKKINPSQLIENQPLQGERGEEALSLRGVSILVMDDEEVLRDIIEEFLLEEGADVRVAARLEDAISFMKEGFKPQLALLDVQMPEKMGPECLETLKELQPTIKVLFMSGHVGSSLLNDYVVIAKPFTQKQLRRALCDIL